MPADRGALKEVPGLLLAGFSRLGNLSIMRQEFACHFQIELETSDHEGHPGPFNTGDAPSSEAGFRPVCWRFIKELIDGKSTIPGALTTAEFNVRQRPAERGGGRTGVSKPGGTDSVSRSDA